MSKVIKKQYMEKQNLNDYISMFEKSYEPIQNVERDFYHVLARIIEAIANCSQDINKLNETGVAKNLPKIFSWYCSLVYKAGIEDIDNAIWKKFPNCCPYCLKSPCSCVLGKKSLEDNSAQLKERAKAEKQRPHSLDAWQTTFASIYPREPQMFNLTSNFLHLIEELGETAEAYRVHYFFPQVLESELADVFTWIIGMANLLHSRAKDNRLPGYHEYRLAHQVFSHYKICTKCNQIPCTCSIEASYKKISDHLKKLQTVKAIIIALDKAKEDLQLEVTSKKLNEIFKESEAISFVNKLKDSTYSNPKPTEIEVSSTIKKIITDSQNPQYKKWYEAFKKSTIAAGVAENCLTSLFTSLIGYLL